MDNNIKEKEVIVTTSLTLVIVTTLLYGSTMALVQRKLVPPQLSDKHEYDEDIDEDEDDSKRINNSHSEHEEFLHPNMIKETEMNEDLTRRKSQLTKS